MVLKFSILASNVQQTSIKTNLKKEGENQSRKILKLRF